MKKKLQDGAHILNAEKNKWNINIFEHFVV